MPEKPLRISICAQQLADVYSGGRYHAWVMGEALAAAGHKVTAWVDCYPYVARDFESFANHGRIKFCISPDFTKEPGPCDVLVVVPHSQRAFGMYGRALLYARRARCRVVLLNFESPNWFNAYSPEPRPVSQWDDWVLVSRYSDLILSSAAESQSWAERFYTEAHGSAVHRFCYPAINTPIADSVPEEGRQKRVVCMTRFFERNLHKGAMDLLLVLPDLRGFELHLLVSPNNLRGDRLDPLRSEASAQGVGLAFHTCLTDREKFRLLRSAQGMLFLSHFEGYGYPPLEALYCGTPCVCYELPVLREVSGDSLSSVPKGDTARLSRQVRSMLARRVPVAVSDRVAHVASFERYARELDAMFRQLHAGGHRPAITGLNASARRAIGERIGVVGGVGPVVVRRFVDWSKRCLADSLGAIGR